MFYNSLFFSKFLSCCLDMSLSATQIGLVPKNITIHESRWKTNIFFTKFSSQINYKQFTKLQDECFLVLKIFLYKISSLHSAVKCRCDINSIFKKTSISVLKFNDGLCCPTKVLYKKFILFT